MKNGSKVLLEGEILNHVPHQRTVPAEKNSVIPEAS